MRYGLEIKGLKPQDKKKREEEEKKPFVFQCTISMYG